MGRNPCCFKEGLNRGAWTALEDKILTEYIKIHGEGKWRYLPKKAGLKRCGKSCRLRWLNYLRPDIKRGNISSDEEELIIRLHRLLGNRWSLIAGRLPGRTDNEIKNYWNTNLGKKVKNHSTSTLNEQKKMPIIIPSVEELQPPPAKLESCVVRTKATRFTKVTFTPKPPDAIEHIDTNAVVAPSVNNNIVESEAYDGLSLITPGEYNLPDFMMDLNMGELHLSDLLNSDLSEFFNFDNVLEGDCTNGDDNELSPSSHQSLLFPDDKMVNGTRKDCVQPNMVSDLGSLASLLNYEEDWLGE